MDWAMQHVYKKKSFEILKKESSVSPMVNVISQRTANKFWIYIYIIYIYVSHLTQS